MDLKYFKLQRGMSLIELMVAMTVFALVLVGIVPVMLLTIGYNREAKRAIEARNVLNNFTETLKSLPMSHVFRQDDGDADDLADNVDPDHSQVQDRFTVNWNIRQVNLFQQDVRIFVNWQDRRGQQRTISTDITIVGG